MYRHLFVPVDDSSLSIVAMEGAIELAGQLGARITGFCVLEDAPIFKYGTADRYAKDVEAWEKTATLQASELLAKFEEKARAAGIEFASLSCPARDIDHAIAAQALAQGCDMIVMVTHGRSKVGDLLFGSHTKKLISETTLPLLILHAKSETGE